jgi:pyridoxal phosphate enzyme (YggS family)
VTRADQIVANLGEVRARMAAALAGARREPGETADVCLLAVSKTVSPEDIVTALQAGQRDFAENYGQEFRDKYAAVAGLLAATPDLPLPRWHFIGPLQSNKVKYVAGKVVLVQSVGSSEVLAELERKAAVLDLVQDCLIQVNVAGEVQKSGIAPAALPSILDSFTNRPHLRCLGLMVIPPYDENPELSRPHFAALRRLRDEQRAQKRANVALTELSMGMSHDMEVAIAEGATIVRVGTAIFGARTYGGSP